ncbi:hypothetical protein FE257_003070 [Aspergillus nanangensis]|uniref:Uncharacterized protein n=1 Tax=Aspergillus nanangensis TaxID=2582783 RepID=A0AAD4CC25_ASPNN|nr:hypothetical protein FE257_003070 [Aspergillus nanangensis]
MEPTQETPSADTGSPTPALNNPRKRRPPKLKQKEVIEEQGPSNSELDDKSDAKQFPDTPGDDPTSIGRQSAMDKGMDKEYNDDPDELTPEEEIQEPRQEIQPHQARKAAVADRPETAPVKNWQRRKHGKSGTQQLVPVGDVGDVGKTVNETTDLVQDVGSKAINTVGNTAGKALGDVVGGTSKKEKDEQLRLRLDLNLDIEVQLKAKIHGDLTLQLLN